METLTYKTPAGGDIEKALAFCERGFAGAEAYTFLTLERAHLPAGRFFCAENAAGGIVSAVFFNGDLAVKLLPGVSPYGELDMLAYRGAAPAPGRAEPLTAADTLAAYRALGGGSLTYDNELRWVYRARAMREGLACGFGVKENGVPVSFAYIAAQNLDSALLGDVYTLPALRGRGLARDCVLACVRAALAAGKTPFLVCARETAGYYEKLGFAEVL